MLKAERGCNPSNSFLAPTSKDEKEREDIRRDRRRDREREKKMSRTDKK